MNTIFRPNNNFGTLIEDNLLEINLTVETLQFMESSILKDVPNRGFDNQEDIFMTGIPYQQTVSDRLNESKGIADPLMKQTDIHFEQGLLMRVPASTSPDTFASATICRMGSIPHGTTINMQDFEPKSPGNGKPNILPIKITPTFIVGANIGKPQGFANMKTQGKVNPVKEADVKLVGARNVRIPDDLTNFDTATNKTMTMASVNNPNQFLTEINDKKVIDSHFEFTVKTKHPKLAGGGVANIAFLMDGAKKTVSGSVPGNANATNVDCTYWVSTLSHKVTIPPDDYTSKDFFGKPKDDIDGVPGPHFQVKVGKKTTQENTIDVKSTQIQYSQNVRLDFGVLAWPHISVATLAPALPILITADDPALKNVK